MRIENNNIKEKYMNKKELKELIKKDKKLYCSNNKLKKVYEKITRQKNIQMLECIIYARKYRFYLENKKGILNKLKFVHYARLNNLHGRKNNIELYGKFGKNLKIYHSGIIINKEAIIGENVKLHGLNCIGNNGKDNKAPKIGNNVDIGVGAILIGNIEIADNIKIGANSVVTKNFLEEGITIAGIPAKKINSGGKNE